jgi:diacylglycerol O-acyltransferase / wax synthase
VEQMLGLDAKFLYSETPTAHMHTLKVAVFDMSGVPRGYDFDRVVTLFERRLTRLAPFRRRVVPVPLALGHPVWIEDPDFDLRRHVSRRRLDPPGGNRELAALVGEIAGRPLARDRPLWELVVVEGLDAGRIAVVAKVHHAVADGATTVALLEQALASEPRASSNAWQPEPVPRARTLLRAAASEHRKHLRRAPWLLTRSAAGLRGAASRRRQAAPRPPLPFSTPRTPFNVSISPQRTFAMTTLPLDELKGIRRAFGATLNDVFLAVCSGAIRAYLLGLSALPERPLVASVPVATRSNAQQRGGNHVDNLYISIATECADPAERLRRIRASSAGAKQVREALGNDLLAERAEVVPPQLYQLSIRAWTRSRLANHLRPPVNVIPSNVAGPQQRLRLDGAELEALYSVGPILEGIGCNITAWSYAGTLQISVLGCPRSLPDPWLLADALPAALDELVDASGLRPIQARTQ